MRYISRRAPSPRWAVAKVVLNRLKDPNYPKTICGVVYQGASRNNSCQFSFACDGLSDQPTVRSSWKQAKRVAAKAMAGDESIKTMTAATHYHADYVTPKWAASLKRVIKIGRHIFYTDSLPPARPRSRRRFDF